MYLFFLLFAMCSAYFGLTYLYWAFFEGRLPPPFRRRSLYSILGISVFMLLVFMGVYLSPSMDIGIGNRILHAIGGGFLAYIVCVVAVRDSGLRIRGMRFFIFSFLIVTALGVANEMLEFLLQSYTPLVFSPTVTDTWLDLASNLVGTLLGAIATIFLLKTDSKA